MIIFDKEKNVIELRTANSLYRMAVAQGVLINTAYCGAETLTDEVRSSYTVPRYDFAPPCYEPGEWFNELRLEYSAFGVGDFRTVPLRAVRADEKGKFCASFFKFVGAETASGKLPIEGMPSFDRQCETLTVTLADDFGTQVKLIYNVYEDCDLITRHAEIINAGQGDVTLEKAASVCLDFEAKSLDLMTFNGEWAQERAPERLPLRYGVQSIGSARGISGHEHNPSIVLCSPDADEDSGTAYGFALVYSGSFLIEVQKNRNSVRLCAGINPDGFKWILKRNEKFVTPELAMICSNSGLGRMSRMFHKAIREHLIPAPWSDTGRKRPVLINSWEAAYFDFDDEKLLALARKAKIAGCDLFVLDDGWFGSRDDDSTSLGDWFPDEKKFPSGLDNFAERLRELCFDFGIWFEPEAICEQSRLFAEHPDWAFIVPGKEPLRKRHQLTLDFTRAEVRNGIYDRMAELIKKCGIKYVKWDMNRSFTDVYSSVTPYGEIYHRYVLGVYELQKRLCEEFPDLLLENCSSGGGRFDCGMLCYSPQIWCSDNTDAFDRLNIQYGTSFIYPTVCVGSHYSIVPNHITKRNASVSDRMAAALSGTFGYELDMTSIDDSELNELAKFSEWYKENGSLIRSGDYYRLGAPKNNSGAWLIMSQDKRQAILFCVGSCKDAEKASDYLDGRLSYKQERLCDGVIKYTAE